MDHTLTGRKQAVFFDPTKGHGLRHDPLMAIIAPRPIGWISSRSVEGINNLAPYSFFNLLSHSPPLLAFCSNGAKDSANNVAETGEFAWNLATRPLAEAMNLSSALLAPEVDEFEVSGLTPESGRVIAAPMVAESPVKMECRVVQIVRLQDLDGTTAPGRLVIGQIVGVHIAHDVIVDGAYDMLRAQPICRAGGNGDYFEPTRDGFFHMPRP